MSVATFTGPSVTFNLQFAHLEMETRIQPIAKARPSFCPGQQAPAHLPFALLRSAVSTYTHFIEFGSGVGRNRTHSLYLFPNHIIFSILLAFEQFISLASGFLVPLKPPDDKFSPQSQRVEKTQQFSEAVCCLSSSVDSIPIFHLHVSDAVYKHTRTPQVSGHRW